MLYVREDGRRDFHRELALLAKSGHQSHRGEQERNVWLRPRKGVPVDAAVTVAIVRDRNGRAVGLRWLVRDAAARRQAEADQYRLLVEGTRDYAMILMDKEGCVTGWNKGAERILKWTAPEMLGRPADFIFTPEDRESGVSARQLMEAAALGRATDLRWHPRMDGSRFYADGIMEALRDEDGGLRGFARILRDATEAKQAQDALQAAEDNLRDTSARLEAALSAGGIATFSWDLVSDTVQADAEMARLFSVSPEDAAGGRRAVYLQAVHPDDLALVNGVIAEAVARADVSVVGLRVVLPGGAVRRLEARGKVERDAQGCALSITGVVVDTTERVERERRARFLAELAERARALSDPDAVIADTVHSVGEFLGVSRCLFADIDIEADVCTVSPDYRADDSVTSMAGAFPISDFGPFLVGEYGAGRTVTVDDVRAAPMRIPADFLGAYEDVACRAFIAAPVLHSDRLVSVIAVHSVTPRCWEPEEIELLQAVVERTWLTVEVTRRGAALAREAEAMARVLESITDAFYAFDGEWRFTHVNAHAERLLCRPRAELLGRVVWDEFPEAVGTKPFVEYRRAVTEQVPVAFEEFYVPLATWFEVRAYPSPDGLSVFFQDITARKEAEAERERTLEEQRARAEREVLVSRIGRAVLGTPDPDAIQECAVALLGEALGVDRCDFSSWDAPVMEALFACGTAVIPDVRSSGLPAVVVAALEGSALRSVLAVPFFGSDGRVGAALLLAMADGPRLWTPEEVAVVETVAALTRAAVEAARSAGRERNVAAQLTQALQPETPASAPGLALADFYRPAWEDQGVGGDFSDVFSGGAGVTFLVVGDLTGKGLTAASQVATVRQMLRFALLNPSPDSSRRVAGPVTALNGTLADHGLISGFATLFVGRYDAQARALSYVNCGQDAGLLLRAATGAVEELPQTGPVLGTFEGVVYGEETVTLETGDVLALFTDGLSEAGPSRSAMLGGDGVAALLQGQAGRRDAPLIVSHLMAGVDAHSGDGPRDDQCLLVAVASGKA